MSISGLERMSALIEVMAMDNKVDGLEVPIVAADGRHGTRVLRAPSRA